MNLPTEWWHWSHTGHLKANPLHAGTLLAALHRGKHLMGVRLEKIQPDSKTGSLMPWITTSSNSGSWTPTLYRLRLDWPIYNPDDPIEDWESWGLWAEKIPWLYWNDYEGKVEGSDEKQLSVIAPLHCWTVLERIPNINLMWDQWMEKAA